MSQCGRPPPPHPPAGLYDVGIDLPGTALRRGILARGRLQELLWPEMKERAAVIAAKVSGH